MVLHFYQSTSYLAYRYQSPSAMTGSTSASRPDHSCWAAGSSTSSVQSSSLNPSVTCPISTMALTSWQFCTYPSKCPGLAPCWNLATRSLASILNEAFCQHFLYQWALEYRNYQALVRTWLPWMYLAVVWMSQTSTWVATFEWNLPPISKRTDSAQTLQAYRYKFLTVYPSRTLYVRCIYS